MSEHVLKEQKAVSTKGQFTAKVFGFMFGGLLITALVAAFTSFLLTYLAPEAVKAHQFPTGFAVAVILASIGFLVCMIITQVQAAKNNAKGALVLGIISAATMGVMVSSFTIFLEWWIIASAFGITSLIFGIMFLIGYFSKKDLSVLALVGFGLLAGVGILGLTTLFVCLFLRGNAQIYTLCITSIVISAVMTLYVLLISIVDMQRIRQAADAGETSNSVALLLATALYVDFIYIFLRVLILIARFTRH